MVRVIKNLGFTGTRNGLTEAQKRSLGNFLKETFDFDSDFNAHHGGCDGADKEFHNIVSAFTHKIIVHPGNIQQASNFRSACYFLHHPKDYLKRNKDIVNESDLLIVGANGFKEESRSGTWMTYRYAKSKKKPILIIYPDGSISNEI